MIRAQFVKSSNDEDFQSQSLFFKEKSSIVRLRNRKKVTHRDYRWHEIRLQLQKSVLRSERLGRSRWIQQYDEREIWLIINVLIFNVSKKRKNEREWWNIETKRKIIIQNFLLRRKILRVLEKKLRNIYGLDISKNNQNRVLRVVRSQAIFFMKSMSERDGSDLYRLWILIFNLFWVD